MEKIIKYRAITITNKKKKYLSGGQNNRVDHQLRRNRAKKMRRRGKMVKFMRERFCCSILTTKRVLVLVLDFEIFERRKSRDSIIGGLQRIVIIRVNDSFNKFP